MIWLAYILTEGDHRKSSVADYIEGMQTTLQEVTGQKEVCFHLDRMIRVGVRLS